MTIDHRVEEAVHVFNEGSDLAILYLEQLQRRAKAPATQQTLTISNRNSVDMVRRHTDNHLGQLMNSAGYEEKSIEGVPYYERPDEDGGVDVLVLSNITEGQYIAYQGVTFFHTKKARDVFRAYESSRRKKARGIIIGSVIGSVMTGINHFGGAVNWALAEIAVAAGAGVASASAYTSRRTKARQSPYASILVTGYDAFQHALGEKPARIKEQYWNPAP